MKIFIPAALGKTLQNYQEEIMKKFVCIMAVFAVLSAQVNAQEQEQQPPVQEQAQQAPAPQMPPPAYAKLWMGDLTIHGRLLTGARAAMTNREGLDEDGNWSLQAVNADWQENRAELTFDYALGSNMGAFLMLQARAWSPNTFGDGVKPRYAFVWTSFLDDKIKFSFGKLYDEILIMQNKVWKTEGFGDLFRFTDEDKFSARLEVKPIPGLNVGAQFFFVDSAFNAINSSLADRNLADTGAWKEIGLGAMYTHDLFNAQLGVRFDSNVDIMNRDDSKTYLSAYYGDANMLGTAGSFAMNGAQSGLGPKYKHAADVIAAGTPTLKPGGNVTNPNDYEVVVGETPFYEGGHYAFAGFKLTGVKNVDFDIHGGLYNLGAFDKFGYGRLAERFMYKNVPVQKLGLGLIMQQEFYGGDVWDDRKQIAQQTLQGPVEVDNPNYRVNSPFLQFAPWISYDFAYLPGTNAVPMAQVSAYCFFGISPDILDSYVNGRLSLDLLLGVFSAKIFYDITYTDFVDAAAIKPETKHLAGLALDFKF
jgi:hypothetical protein